MVDNIGGILRQAPSYKQILIAPRLDSKLSWAAVSYRSIHGLIATEWRKELNQSRLDVTIPANTTAVVAIPTGSAEKITESGRPLSQAEGVLLMGRDGESTLVNIGSGKYSFAVSE
jgi:alpha-L-rhamnosidase